jgi:hypothetical protein
MSEAINKEFDKEFVTPEEFVTIWQGSSNIQEVMKKTNMSYSQAYQRARNYRTKYKLPLKDLSTQSRQKLDVDKLKKMAEEIISQSK